MDKRIDLHIHSTASDGVFAPTILVNKAKDLDLSAIAITDHDSVSGIDEAIEAGQTANVEIVPGIELSTIYHEQEFHLLGYFIDHHADWFQLFLRELREVREHRADKIISILQAIGYTIDLDSIKKQAKEGSVGKPHLAVAVIKHPQNQTQLLNVFGHIPSVSEFIETYLIKGKLADVPKKRLDLIEGIAYIKKLGGLPVLAHPGYDLKQTAEGIATLKELQSHGLVGLEVFYFVENDDRTQQSIAFWEKNAVALGLLMTGGSDFHGEDASLGANLGLRNTKFMVKYSLLEQLKKRLNK